MSVTLDLKRAQQEGLMMLDPTLMIPFFLAVTVILFSPGPNLVLLVSTGTFYGFATALFTAFGITTALFLSSLLSILGLSALTGRYPYVLTYVGLLGGLYFLYQALKLFRSPRKQLVTGAALQVLPRNAFLQGFSVESINPYSLLFTLSFLPQFVNSNLGPTSIQLLLLALLYCICDLGFNMGVAWCSSRCGWIFRKQTTPVACYLIGAGYVCLSCYVLVRAFV